ncbi:MAG: VIT1/CCC1 transporter family protein [bacterium]|nr:VIT1/CCC1 transporter family protein [bacterium]
MLGLFKPVVGAERHKYGNSLRDVILGGQDGLVNVLGVVLGVSAATSEKPIILAAALAATFAESVSMGAVAYTSFLSERDHYQKELQNELWEIKHIPEKEKEEIREIYSAKGFKGQLLEEIVDTICADEKTWVNIMMSEELHLSPVETKTVYKLPRTNSPRFSPQVYIRFVPHTAEVCNLTSSTSPL